MPLTAEPQRTQRWRREFQPGRLGGYGLTAPVTTGGSDSRSRHRRQRQPLYRDFNSARASSLNLISEHQQPRKLAPHENSSPQASQTEGPLRRVENRPASFRSSIFIYLPPHR